MNPAGFAAAGVEKEIQAFFGIVRLCPDWENPLDCFGYYAPGESAYREVEIEDNGERRNEDTKVVGKKIKIGAELKVADICKAHFEFVKEHTTFEHTDSKQATAGNYGAATAGDSGAATAGDRGAATAGDRGAATAGYRGAATSRGKSAVGKNGIAVARGNGCLVRGGVGAVLLLAEEKDDSFDLASWKAVVVDGERIKADTWYALKDGEFVEVK